MNHLFKVTFQGKSKYITVEGTQEYAISYISGYVQALRDKFGNSKEIRVQQAPKEILNDKN